MRSIFSPFSFRIPQLNYLLFVLREMIYLRVALFRRVFFPSGSPHGEHPGLPPEDLPSPPPSG